MATDVKRLLERALDARQRLEELGLGEEARVVSELIESVEETRAPEEGRGFYTTTEAARLIGVTAQTIKNWVARGLLAGYRLGGRIVIPRAALEEYLPLARAMRGIEPLPPVDQIVEEVRAGRKRPPWTRQDGNASAGKASE